MASELDDSQRERARRVLSLLRSLGPGVLDRALGLAYGDDAAVIRASLDGPDPEQAFAQVMRDVSSRTSPDRARVRALFQEAKDISGVAAQAGRALASVRAHRDELAALGTSMRSAVTDEDPELAALLDEALGMLGADAPFAALQAAVTTISDAEKLLAQVGPGMASEAQMRGLVALDAQRAALATASSAFARVPELISSARTQARDRGDARGDASLAIFEAALRDREPGSELRWRDAFERAVDSRLLQLAAASATRLELAALAEGRVTAVLETAPRIAELAAEVGDVDAEIAALGDEALIWCQTLEGRDRAHELVERAQLIAGDDSMRTLRVSLLDAQVRERAGDEARARKLYREIMQYGADLDGAGHVIGWAALHLGRLEAKQGHRFRANQDLLFAQQIGDAAGDPALLALAAGARLDLASDRTSAAAVLESASNAPEAAKRELLRRFETRWRILDGA